MNNLITRDKINTYTTTETNVFEPEMDRIYNLNEDTVIKDAVNWCYILIAKTGNTYRYIHIPPSFSRDEDLMENPKDIEAYYYYYCKLLKVEPIRIHSEEIYGKISDIYLAHTNLTQSDLLEH